MVPARNPLRRHYDSYGGGCFDNVDAHYGSKQSPSSPLIRSNLMMMAEHHTSTTTATGGAGGGQGQEQQETTQEQESDQEQQVGTSTTSKPPPPPPDDSWLQLGIGVSPSSAAAAASFTTTAAVSVSAPSVELQLFSDKPSSSTLPTVSRPMMFSSAALPPPQLGYRSPWGFWNMGGAGGSSSSTSPVPQLSPLSSPMMMPQIYNVQRYPLPQRPAIEGGPHFGEVRVVSPPVRRQQATGVWFLLKAAENQVREPFLPQIPKSYIRIKDGRMTVRLLMKYLVKKLGLDHESEDCNEVAVDQLREFSQLAAEVQISCRGRLLPPSLTLQHVRDHIWCPSEAVAFLPDSPSIDHVMTLQYSRSP